MNLTPPFNYKAKIKVAIFQNKKNKNKVGLFKFYIFIKND